MTPLDELADDVADKADMAMDALTEVYYALHAADMALARFGREPWPEWVPCGTFTSLQEARGAIDDADRAKREVGVHLGVLRDIMAEVGTHVRDAAPKDDA